MKLSLSQNICKLRKANHLTQEQLAEALGVTFAAISKWERGAATPELTLIAQMADLFGVSMDVLVGFEVRNNHITAVEERIHNLQRSKQYGDAMAESESALLRYPNDFRIVYRAGEVYAFAGMEGKAEPHLRRCIALLEHAISLLSQNTGPEISEVSIQS
ncbi:MAG TPA: helix-turn-helix transcriptional regulator, partial [Candidatus Avoscillospira avistercoris]|nr:helix-turn-helix transcriptional regulator [Candidatus Avoscillospira avistercoris]